jgi:hypothetical protein
MCDYSLHTVKSRPAKVGDKLTTHRFGERGRSRQPRHGAAQGQGAEHHAQDPPFRVRSTIASIVHSPFL